MASTDEALAPSEAPAETEPPATEAEPPAETPEPIKPLRFKVGDLVLYRYSNGWFEGRISALHYRDPKWDDEHPAQAYQIAGRSHSVCALDDTDKLVRRHAPDMTPDLESNPPSPEVMDPNSHLYIELNTAEWPLDFQNQVRGYMLTKRPKKHVATRKNLPSARHGLNGELVAQVAQVVIARRRYQVYGQEELEEVFDSVVPPENDLQELEKLAATRIDKMLQLADSLMFGWKGFGRDPTRAFKLYHCVAFACTENMVEKVTSVQGAYPVGLPEAACCVAQSFHNHCMLTAFGNRQESGSQSVSELFKIARRKPEVLKGLKSLLQWYNHAIRRGHICPNALRYAEALCKLPEKQQEAFGNSEPMKRSLQYRRVEMEKEKSAVLEQWPMNRPDAKAMTLKLFGLKVDSIYKSLPTNNRVSTIHIEIRSMPLPNFPLFLVMINRTTSALIKAWRLLDKFQTNPFVPESLYHSWLLIVYELHLGVPAGKAFKRCRPTIITLPSGDEDHVKFADFVSTKLVGGENGTTTATSSASANTTTVELVDDTNICRSIMMDDNAVDRPLRDVMISVEKQVVTTIGECYTYEALAETTLSKYRGHRLPQKIAMDLATNAKEEGNAFFAAQNYVAARYAYTDGIVLLKFLHHKPEHAYQLLGTMASNRAACDLEISSRCHWDVAIPFLKEIALHCSLVLKAPWKKLLPDTIRAKLAHRRDAAVERIKMLKKDKDAIEAFENGSKASKSTGGEDASITGNASIDEYDDATAKIENLVVGDEAQLVRLGSDIFKFYIAKNNAKDDICPACIGRFKVECAERYCTALMCGHVYCLPCIADISQRASGRKSLCCPLCRTKITHLGSIVDEVLSEHPEWQTSAADFSCKTQEHRKKLVSQLVIFFRFDVTKITYELEWFKIPNSFDRQARGPFEKLSKEIAQAHVTYLDIYDFASPKKQQALDVVRQQVKAFQEAFQASTDKKSLYPEFCFDFSGMPFIQARMVYDNIVVPCLQVMERVFCEGRPEVIQFLQSYAQMQHKEVTWGIVRQRNDLAVLLWGAPPPQSSMTIGGKQTLEIKQGVPEIMPESDSILPDSGLLPNEMVYGFNSLN